MSKTHETGTHRMAAQIKALADGELHGWQRWQVQRHVTRCAACQQELHTLTELGRVLSQLDTALPSPNLRARILADLPTPISAPTVRTVPSRVRYAPPVRRLAWGGGFTALSLAGLFALTHISFTPISRSHPPATPTVPQTLPIAPTQTGTADSAPATAVQRVASTNVPSEYTDEVSRQAEVLTRKRLAALPRRTTKTNRPSNKALTGEPQTGNATDKREYAFLVDNVDAARQQFADLAQRVGGTAHMETGSKEGAEGNKTASTSTLATSNTTPPDGYVTLALRVPTAQAGRMSEAIKQLTATEKPDAPFASASPAGKLPMPKAIMMADNDSLRPQPFMRPLRVPVKPGWVTYTIRLKRVESQPTK